MGVKFSMEEWTEGPLLHGTSVHSSMASPFLHGGSHLHANFTGVKFGMEEWQE